MALLSRCTQDRCRSTLFHMVRPNFGPFSHINRTTGILSSLIAKLSMSQIYRVFSVFALFSFFYCTSIYPDCIRRHQIEKPTDKWTISPLQKENLKTINLDNRRKSGKITLLRRCFLPPPKKNMSKGNN